MDLGVRHLPSIEVGLRPVPALNRRFPPVYQRSEVGKDFEAECGRSHWPLMDLGVRQLPLMDVGLRPSPVGMVAMMVHDVRIPKVSVLTF